MKRLMVCMIGFVFLFALSVSAVEQVCAAKAQKEPAKEKVAKRQKTGNVVTLTDVMLKIEFTKKGKTETMEFALTAPVKVAVGEKVTVYYTEKDGRKEVLRVKSKEGAAKKPSRSKTISKN